MALDAVCDKSRACIGCLALTLTNPSAKKRNHSRNQKKHQERAASNSQRMDAASVAAAMQLREENREVIYSIIVLAMKVGLLALGTVSLVKLGFASHQRVDRHSELSSVLGIETSRLISLQKRFDHLFTIGGNRRLMDENDQWIEPNRVRVIWR